MADYIRCPSCGGRGFTVALNSMLPCGRCHGMGRVDLEREEAQRRDEDERQRRRVKDALNELDEVIQAAFPRFQAKGDGDGR